MATQTPQLRRRLVVAAASVAVVLALGMALIAGQSSRAGIERMAKQRGLEVGTRVGALASTYMQERRRQAELTALNPGLATAAHEAGQQAVAQGLDGLDIPTLRRRLRERPLNGPPHLARYLRDLAEHGDLAEVSITERHGLVVLASGRPSSLVRADEESWRVAMRDGVYEGTPRYDSSATVLSIEYDVALRVPGVPRPAGVLRIVYPLNKLAWLLAVTDLGDGAYLQVVDSLGRQLVTGDPTQILQPIANVAAIPRREQPDTATVETPAGLELVVSIPANRGRWWVLFRQPTAQAYAVAGETRRTIGLGLAVLLGATGLLLWYLVHWITRRVIEPVKGAGVIATRVAGGDLSVAVGAARAETAEVAELMTALHRMVAALQRLVGSIRRAADEAAAMAAEISASTQQMSAATQEMAATTQDLTRRAAEQSQLVRAGADDAGRILQIATILSGGADEAARRNAALAALARQHRELLDQSTAQLQQLAEEVHRGATEAEALAQASAEIQKFVTQAKAVATQTNLLALNAAIEAARAGPQGRGFAVVADEVRKLAAQAAGAAGSTADTVRGVLGRVQATRDRLVRLAASGAAAREASQVASQALNRVAAEADANDAWSREIASSAADVKRLVEEIAARLAALAQGTDSFVMSAEGIAASSEEQNASTAEIASSANQLATAADNLSAAVKTFRLPEDDRVERRQAAD